MHVIKQLVILFSIILFLNGCSGSFGDFFSVRYQNVMGYFNTYYNASKTFDEAITELKKNPSKDLDTNYFAPYILSTTVKTKFNLVLEKASKILQFYPKSKWVDNALIMIGEVYYHQGESDLAIRKFEELITNFPKSKYFWKAHLLYARTLYDAEEYDNAISYIDKILTSVTAQDEDIAIELYLLKAQIFYEQKQYSKALNSLSELLKIDGDEYLLARAAYMKGRVHEVTNEYELAKNSYLSVMDYDPDRNLEFRAKLSYAKMLRELGEYENSLAYLTDMRKDELTQTNLSYIDLDIAVTYDKMRNLETAIIKYELVDSLYKKTDASAKSFYYRGLMYEKALDFAEAKFYYDKARTEFPQSEITITAQTKYDIFTRLLQIQKDLAVYDSLYKMLTDTTKIKDTIAVEQVDPKTDSIETMVFDTVPEITDTLVKGENVVQEEDILEDPSEVQDLNQKVPVILSNQVNITPDSVIFLKVKAQIELATIYFLDLGLLDSAEFWFLEVIHSKYKDFFAPKSYYSLMEINRIKGENEKVDYYYNTLLSEYPQSEYAQAARKLKGENVSEIKKSDLEPFYEKALIAIENKKAFEAIRLLKNICQTDTLSEHCIKSIYTIGWVFENILNNNDSAKFYYKILLDKYSQSTYASAVIGKVTVAEDTTKLSQFVKFKEIVPPPPPTPKYTQTEQRLNRQSAPQQKYNIRSRDVREEEEEQDIPEMDIDDEEPID